MSEIRGVTAGAIGTVCYFCGELFRLDDYSHCPAWPDEPEFVHVTLFDVLTIQDAHLPKDDGMP